jgi:acetoin utilization deacetylase AcuC-like enzyme
VGSTIEIPEVPFLGSKKAGKDMHDLVLYYPEGHEGHFSTGHPERPERVEAIRRSLIRAGRWDQFPHVKPLNLAESVIHAIHTPAYLKYLEDMSRQSGWFDSDTYTTPASWQLANLAAGGGAAVASAVWTGSAKRGFALTRPPGHHATSNRAMGFCLLNNVALAAEHLLAQEGAQRLAIVDLDLHHGNGTQDIFYQRGDVMYLSTHQSPHYPGSGGLNETGAGPGAGMNVNLPLPAFSGDEAFRTLMQACILPLLDRSRPDMLLISVGFDVHWRDPLGQLMLSTAAFGEILAHLCQWADQNCNGKIAVLLEGGYDLDAAGSCGLATVEALLGEQWQDDLGPSPYRETLEWQRTLEMAKRIWEL